MDINIISEMISSVGFPIVCFVMCGYYVKYREDRNDEKFDKLNNQHDEESKNMITAINNNTLALQQLIDKLKE